LNHIVPPRELKRLDRPLKSGIEPHNDTLHAPPEKPANGRHKDQVQSRDRGKNGDNDEQPDRDFKSLEHPARVSALIDKVNPKTPHRSN
jgi:hypothetical protein